MPVVAGFGSRTASTMLVKPELAKTEELHGRYPGAVTTTVCQTLPSSRNVVVVVSQSVLSMQARAPESDEWTVIRPGAIAPWA
jgi:hypothetical protein